MASDSITRITQPIAGAGQVQAQGANSVVRNGGKDLPGGKPVHAEDGGNLSQAVSRLNAHVQNIHRELEFSIDKATGRTIIKVIDSSTKEVIRQLPPEEVLQVARRIAAMQEGTILRVKA
jgi:flagellar protein FlaG